MGEIWIDTLGFIDLGLNTKNSPKGKVEHTLTDLRMNLILWPNSQRTLLILHKNLG